MMRCLPGAQGLVSAVHRPDVLPRQSARAALLKSVWRKMFPVGNAVLFKRPWLLHASSVPFAEAVARKAQIVCSRTGTGAVVASVGCAVCRHGSEEWWLWLLLRSVTVCGGVEPYAAHAKQHRAAFAKVFSRVLLDKHTLRSLTQRSRS